MRLQKFYINKILIMNMSLFNYNFFPILFFLIWNILYVKPFFNQKSNYQSSLYHTLKFPRNSNNGFEKSAIKPHHFAQNKRSNK